MAETTPRARADGCLRAGVNGISAVPVNIIYIVALGEVLDQADSPNDSSPNDSSITSELSTDSSNARSSTSGFSGRGLSSGRQIVLFEARQAVRSLECGEHGFGGGHQGERVDGSLTSSLDCMENLVCGCRWDGQCRKSGLGEEVGARRLRRRPTPTRLSVQFGG